MKENIKEWFSTGFGILLFCLLVNGIYAQQSAFTADEIKADLVFLKQNLIEKHQVEVDINEWIYETGLPKNCPKVVSQELVTVEEDARNFALEMTLPNADKYTTHHWLHFFRTLQGNINLVHLQELDSAFNFTNSTNCEIQCDWYQNCIDLEYKKAYPKVKEFLTTVGRRKFLTPLYSRLIKTREGKNFAKEIFNKLPNKSSSL